jgi:folate-dependent phosphoribosylglycinamide formyltransferase PurN
LRVRVVCLTGPQAHCVYFVNRIHASMSVALCVREVKSAWTQASTAFRKGGVAEVLGGARRQLAKRARRSEVERTHDRFFGDRWRGLDAGIPRRVVEDANDPAVCDALRAERPDVVLDIGTSVLRRTVLATAPLFLNVHAGLSPYYRGTHCTEWALLGRDPLNIGVTVHRIARKIDAGDVYGQARPRILPTDTSFALDMKLVVLGAHLTLLALETLRRGEPLRLAEQDLTRGVLKLNREWTDRERRAIRELDESGRIAELLARPARGPQPIVEPFPALPAGWSERQLPARAS